MILQNRNMKSFFLSKSLEITSLILLLALLLPTHVQAAGVAIGDGASATLGTSTAIGHDARTNEDRSVVIGYNAGELQDPVGNTSAAIGASANPSGANSLVIGSDAQSQGVNSLAIGSRSTANAASATALGYRALVNHEGSIAIGSFSQSHREYAVSVGSGQVGDAATYQYRRITNVATPINGHDVATKEYVDNHHHILGHQFDNIERRVNNLGAMQVSIANAQVQMPSNKHTAIGVGVGAYRGSSAATVGLTHRIPGRLAGLRFTGNLTVANAGEKEGGVGIGYSF